MTQPNPKADSQSPAEALRLQLAAALMKPNQAYKGMKKIPIELLWNLEEVVTAYAATVEREAATRELENLKQYTKHQPHKSLKSAAHARNHLRDDFKAIIDDRLAALQGPQDGDD